MDILIPEISGFLHVKTSGCMIGNNYRSVVMDYSVISDGMTMSTNC